MRVNCDCVPDYGLRVGLQHPVPRRQGRGSPSQAGTDGAGGRHARRHGGRGLLLDLDQQVLGIRSRVGFAQALMTTASVSPQVSAAARRARRLPAIRAHAARTCRSTFSPLLFRRCLADGSGVAACLSREGAGVGYRRGGGVAWWRWSWSSPSFRPSARCSFVRLTASQACSSEATGMAPRRPIKPAPIRRATMDRKTT